MERLPLLHPKNTASAAQLYHNLNGNSESSKLTSAEAFLGDLARLLTEDAAKESNCCYEYFSASVEMCPQDLPGVGDLSSERRNVLIDAGGVGNLFDPARHGVGFDLFSVLGIPCSAEGAEERRRRRQAGSLPGGPLWKGACRCLGACAAAPSLAGQNAEGIMACEVLDTDAYGDNASQFIKITRERAAGCAGTASMRPACTAYDLSTPIPGKSGQAMELPSHAIGRALPSVAAAGPPFTMEPYTSQKLGLLGNFFCSYDAESAAAPPPAAAARPPCVLRVEARGRKQREAGVGADGAQPLFTVHSFTQYLRRLLTNGLRDRGETLPAGLGGVIYVRSGWVQGHVMPDFLKEQMDWEKCSKWLRFFLNGPGDMVMFSTFVTEPPEQDEAMHALYKNLHLYAEHTHFMGLPGTPAEGQGGHYHGDVQLREAAGADETPTEKHLRRLVAESDNNGEVHYVGYFMAAEELIRVNDPAKMMDIDPGNRAGV